MRGLWEGLVPTRLENAVFGGVVRVCPDSNRFQSPNRPGKMNLCYLKKETYLHLDRGEMGRRETVAVVRCSERLTLVSGHN